MGDGGQPRFLRSDVTFEPLVDGFAASLHTVAPVPSALALARTHLPRLASAAQTAELADRIRRDRRPVLAFAAAVREADEVLRRGTTATALYAQLPAMLDGLVEVACGPHGRPAPRYREALVYRSPAYDERRQSVRLSRPSDGDTLELALPLRHEGLAELVASRVRPTTADRLREALGLAGAQAGQLDSFLDTAPGLAPDRHIANRGRIRYFGGACLVVQTPEAAVVVDPSAGTGDDGRYTVDDLPNFVDLVLVTQGDPEHLALATLLQLRGRVGTAVVPRASRDAADPSIALCLRELGFPVVEVDDFDEVPLAGGRVVATPFLSARDDDAGRAAATYRIELGGTSVFAGGDSCGATAAVYRHVHAHLGDVDLAFLGVEDADPARETVAALGADEVYVYGTGGEETDRRKRIEELLGWCGDHGIFAERLGQRREWRW